VSGGSRRFPAPAKLNLMLRVLGRRADGYHLLQTVFRFLDYGDELMLAPRVDGAIVRLTEVPGVPEEWDLCVRAARALKEATATRYGADIALDKRLPLGAGLGGGSSDAATVLIALNHLWGTGLARSELLEIAQSLGADVPVFVFGRSAHARGIGEILEPIDLPPAWYLVVTPPVAVSTARIFAHPDLKRDSEPIKIQSFSAATAVNDLQALVCSLYPEVGRGLEWLSRHGRALMTGSGAALFLSFEQEDAARSLHERLPPGMTGFVAQGLDEHPLRLLAR
jgi:4-diphosphocytidyl-2-C-methyl-D-erythritol kinase